MSLCVTYKETPILPVRFSDYISCEVTPKNVGYGLPNIVSAKGEYLKSVTYDDIDYAFARNYFSKKASSAQPIGCSAVRKGNWFGRNLDWIYGEQLDYIVTTSEKNGRYATLGIASMSALTKNDHALSEHLDDYKILPCYLQDGINSRGVVACTNVVPTDYGFNDGIPLVSQSDTISAVMLVRYILDNFNTAQGAVEYIRDYVKVYMPETLRGMGYEMHYMVADADNTYILEFVNNRAQIIDISSDEVLADRAYMTNFYMYGVTLNNDGTVYTPETMDSTHSACATNGITQYGSGLERYNLIANVYSTIETADDVVDIMKDLYYTKSYASAPTVSDPYWFTEFVGGDITVDTPSDSEEFTQRVGEYADKFTRRSRDSKDNATWQTVHSSVYDIKNKSLMVSTQEGETYYTIPSLYETDIILSNELPKGEVLLTSKTEAVI